MRGRFGKLFKNLRVVVLIICLILAISAIRPNPLQEGVAIRTILSNSSTNLAGMQSPKPNLPPMSREIVTAINNRDITSVEDYEEAIGLARINTSMQIRTNQGLYRVIPKEGFIQVETNETVFAQVAVIREIFENQNGSMIAVNKTFNETQEIPKVIDVSSGIADIGLRVYDAPLSNIRKGLDLQGGTRVMLQPEKKLNAEDMDNLLAVMKERLNVYGLSDLVIREAGDLSGGQFVLVEIAGATEEEVKTLLAQQGKFEASISGQTVFSGGKDITFVCRSPDCSGLDPSRGCQDLGEGWFCRFRFSISMTPEAAQRQADATANLEVITESGSQFLSEDIVLYLDDREVDRLRIGAELKGSADTGIQISGSGVGVTEQEAAVNSLQNMKRLQTIMITGSLPYKLDIVKVDSLSPLLGQDLLNNALFIGLIAILVIALCIYIRYRKLQVVIPLLITSFSELIILMGVAALIGWNIDLAAIAGIIIAIGTGVDHQILITDETLKGEIKQIFNWRERIKGAFFIIMGAYLTTLAAMFPLVFAGAGLLKGFAIITMIGVSIGVFITRPAYAAMVEILLKE
jgi:preprotein translocase subunit SecD